jgi:UDP-glucose 4-epimerase
LQLLEACRAVNPGISIVHARIRQIYCRPDYLPVDERHLAAAGRRQRRQQDGGLPPAVSRCLRHQDATLRLVNVYGPGMRIKDDRQAFLGIWLRRVIEGEPFEV